MSEYIATFKTSQQISQDEWDVFNPTLKLTDQTTMLEIKEWYKKIHRVGVMEIRINELENINPKQEEK